MSNLSALQSIGNLAFLAIIIGLIILDCFRVRRIKRLEEARRNTQSVADKLREERDDYAAELHGAGRHTTAEWREIAFHHARAAKGRDAKTQWVEESNARLLHDNQAWSEQFRYLVIFLWGDPPLERTVQDVCDFIGELRADRQAHFDKAVKLTAAYAALSDRLRELEARLTSCGAEKQRMQEDAASIGEQLHRFKKAIADLLISQELRDRWQAMDIEAIVREIVIGPQEPHQCEWEQRGTGSVCSICGATCPF